MKCVDIERNTGGEGESLGSSKMARARLMHFMTAPFGHFFLGPTGHSFDSVRASFR